MNIYESFLVSHQTMRSVPLQYFTFWEKKNGTKSGLDEVYLAHLVDVQ